MTLDFEFLVLSPSISSNVLGRALFLVDALKDLGPTVVAGVGRGPVWSGAKDFEHSVKRLSDPREARKLINRRLEKQENSTFVLVAVKPFSKSLGLGRQILAERHHRSALLVADVDELDAALSKEFQERSWKNRLRINLLRQQHPRRIEGVLRKSLKSADILSVSTWSLRNQLPRFEGPEVRVPHPRPLPKYSPPLAAGHKLRLGFLGTPREHKGLEILIRAVQQTPFTELHVLEGTVLPPMARIIREQIVFHPHLGARTLDCAFQSIDAVVLPQLPGSKGAEFQLPAKLMDGMRYGRPIIATCTPAIHEVAKHDVMYLDRVNLLTSCIDCIKALWESESLRLKLGSAGRFRFQSHLSSKVMAKSMQSTLEEACRRGFRAFGYQ